MVLAFPRYLYPLTWGAVWLIAEPLLYARDPDHSLFADITRGAWGRIARLMAAGLFAGVLWESFNGLARARWIYTVPFLEHWKIFEMPLVGFLGFPFFALEVWSLYHVLAPRTTLRTVAASVLLALLVLTGIDARTVSSTTPQLADLPGVTNGVIYRLRDAGWTDVFRVAGANGGDGLAHPSRDQQHFPGRLPAFELAVRLRCLRQRELTVDADLQPARLEPAQHLARPREQLGTRRDVVHHRRPGEKQRTLLAQHLRVERSHRAARLAVQHHHAPPREAVQTLIEGRLTDGVVDHLKSG